MKKTLAVLVAAALALALWGCAAKKNPAPGGTTNNAVQNDTGTIYAVFNKKDVRENAFSYPQNACTPLTVAQALTAWTGLQFSISFEFDAQGNCYRVDWKADSSLATGQPPEQQKEDFRFYDADTLRWFMLNSLCRSIRENLEHTDVYYSLNGADLNALELGVDFNPAIAYNRMDDINVIV